MDRRGFVGTAAGALVASVTGCGQSATQSHRAGFVLGATAESTASLLGALKEGLTDRGYVEGRNLTLHARFANGKLERLPELAAELVRLRVEVIVTGTNFHVAAVRRVTTTVPIVMVFAADPVQAGFVASLAHPGGNVTGLSSDAGADVWGKYLGLMREVVPNLSRVGALGQVSARAGFGELEAASQQSGIALTVADLKALEDLDGAFAEMIGKRVEAIVVIVGPLTYQMRKPIAELALKNRIPAISTLSEYAQDGLLMTYGPKLTDLYIRAASYVDKILRGEKPADLPVEQPARFELTINMKTAAALRANVPKSLQILASDVIA